MHTCLITKRENGGVSVLASSVRVLFFSGNGTLQKHFFEIDALALHTSRGYDEAQCCEVARANSAGWPKSKKKTEKWPNF